MKGTFTAHDGAKKLSFGRLAAGIVVLIGLLLVAGDVTMEYIDPSNPVQITQSDGTTITEMHHKHPWDDYGTFLALGITPLATLLYGGGKLAGALNQHVQNGKK